MYVSQNHPQALRGVLRMVSITRAYRSERGLLDLDGGAQDGEWIAIGVLLEHAIGVSSGEQLALLRSAIERSRAAIGEATANRLALREWGEHDRFESEAILLVCDEMLERGAIKLAALTLDILLEVDGSLTATQRGRVLARRARIEWRSGGVDDAADRYRHLVSEGKRTSNNELVVRGLIGLIAVNQMRGNYPELRRIARRAARIAEEAGFARLAREAHSGLMIAASVSGRVNQSIFHGWRVYELSRGDLLDEGEILQNLGQVLLNAGLCDLARAAFSAVASRRLPPRIAVPGLGGLALASSQSGHSATTLWACHQLTRIDRSTVAPFALAHAFLECAAALFDLNKRIQSGDFLREALALADAQGFHEIRLRADSLDAKSRITARRLTGRAVGIAREIARMEPEHLPGRLALAIA